MIVHCFFIKSNFTGLFIPEIFNNFDSRYIASDALFNFGKTNDMACNEIFSLSLELFSKSLKDNELLFTSSLFENSESNIKLIYITVYYNN